MHTIRRMVYISMLGSMLPVCIYMFAMYGDVDQIEIYLVQTTLTDS